MTCLERLKSIQLIARRFSLSMPIETIRKSDISEGVKKKRWPKKCRAEYGGDELICSVIFPCTEAVVQTCSVKKVFLEISQHSQGNTWGLQLC